MNQIPTVDPMPVPGPIWLIKTLLIVVFSLHLIAMNCAVAGTLIAGFNAWRGRSPKHPFSRRLAKELGKALPIFVSVAITLGVAALLFVQVLYGHLLYTSSILMAVPWLGIVGLVIVAYYGVYFFSYRSEGSVAGAVTAMLAFVLFATIGFVFVNNMTLVLTPDRWHAMYAAHVNGMSLNLGEHTLWPRYIHIFLGAFAVFAAVLVHLGTHKMRKDEEYGRWIVKRGAMAFAAITGVQFLVGLWLLAAMPRDVAMVFMTQPLGATLFGLSLVLSLASMMLMLMASSAERPAAMAHAGFTAAMVTVFLMVGMRQFVRTAYLAPVFTTDQLRVAPQWGVITLFLVAFVAGLATLGYMFMLLARSKRNDAERSSAARA